MAAAVPDIRFAGVGGRVPALSHARFDLAARVEHQCRSRMAPRQREQHLSPSAYPQLPPPRPLPSDPRAAVDPSVGGASLATTAPCAARERDAMRWVKRG